MYVNRPGYSAGRATGLLPYAENATNWEAAPAGTRHGYYKRYSLRDLGAFG
jgi:hypothetical protein